MNEDLWHKTIPHNRAALMTALRSLGAQSAVVAYTGEGDSGNGYDVMVTPATAASDSCMVSVQVVRSQYDGEQRKWTGEMVQEHRSLSDALEMFCGCAIDVSGHSGFENNDGGGGELSLNVTEDTCVLEHYDYYTERSEYSHEL